MASFTMLLPCSEGCQASFGTTADVSQQYLLVQFCVGLLLSNYLPLPVMQIREIRSLNQAGFGRHNTESPRGGGLVQTRLDTLWGASTYSGTVGTDRCPASPPAPRQLESPYLVETGVHNSPPGTNGRAGT